MGKFGSRWLGDNGSDEKLMGASVTGIMMHNILGIPLAGADICGFGGNTTPELCARWHIVGAFYPFSRNHNTEGAAPQEFYRWPDTVAAAARGALDMRYRLLPYLYTALHGAHARGTLVPAPLWAACRAGHASASHSPCKS